MGQIFYLAVTPDGRWILVLAVIAVLREHPPDDDALLASLSDDRSTAQMSTLRYVDYLNRLAALELLLRATFLRVFP